MPITRAARRILNTDPVMAGLIAAAGPYRQPHERTLHSPFEALARAIAHQQLNGIAAERILARFVALFAPAPFPEPPQVLAADDAQLRAVGFSFAKIAALKDLAAKTIEGIVPSGDELVAADGCRDHRAAHRGARHRSLDGRDDADVSAAAARCAAGR